jgi:hypothetical protein
MNRGKIYKKLSSRDKIPSQFSKLNVDQAHGWLGIDFRVPFALHNEIKGFYVGIESSAISTKIASKFTKIYFSVFPPRRRFSTLKLTQLRKENDKRFSSLVSGLVSGSLP